MTVKYFPLFIICLLLNIHAFSQENALAFPANNIVIDGSLKDWPEEVNWYRIAHAYDNDDQSNEDYSAQFATSYNVAEQAVYVAVRVLDDEFIGDNGKSHTTQDHMLLYIDAAHDKNGGSPVFFVATDNIIEVHHKPGTFDTRNHLLQLNSAQSARKRLANTAQYEFKIDLPNHVKPNHTLGLDFMLVDADKEDANQTILLWRDGFSKSYGAERLGDLVLLDKNLAIGKVEGHIDVAALDSTSIVNAIDIESTKNPNVRVKAEIDSTGYFQAFLPEGEYNLKPNRHFTSPLYSAGFSQNTRKIEYSNIEPFYISGEQTALLDTVGVKIIPQPKYKEYTRAGLPVEYVTKKEIDEFVKTWQAYFEIPAVSVAVIRNNKVLYNKTLGVTSNVTNEKVNKKTLFEAASITKSVFGIMVMRLAEKGIIDLDKPLHEYLVFPNIEKDERSKLLTARNVLGHQSGLPNWAWGGPGTWEGSGNIELNFTPGTDFGYSGEAFNYLGRVIEHITQKDLETLYQEEIAKPFELKDSYFFYTDEAESRTAMGHHQHFILVKEKDRIASPASSLQTNAHLFKDFVLELMKEKGMSKESYELIYDPYTVIKPEQRFFYPEIYQHVSHGFFIQTTENGMLIGHGGNNGDYDSKYSYNPEKEFAFIVFTNSNLGDEFIQAFEKFLLNR